MASASPPPFKWNRPQKQFLPLVALLVPPLVASSSSSLWQEKAGGGGGGVGRGGRGGRGGGAVAGIVAATPPRPLELCEEETRQILQRPLCSNYYRSCPFLFLLFLHFFLWHWPEEEEEEVALAVVSSSCTCCAVKCNARIIHGYMAALPCSAFFGTFRTFAQTHTHTHFRRWAQRSLKAPPTTRHPPLPSHFFFWFNFK